MTSRLFNPFALFGRKVARKFLIRPREYEKYTEDQLNEEVEHNLRIFNIDGSVWYLAKDVTSYLGINPKHSARALEKINKQHIKQEDVTLIKCGPLQRGLPQTRVYKMYLITEPGIYALIQKSRTAYAELFKSWLNEQVLPSIRTTGEYKAESSLNENIMEVKADQDDREWITECTSKEEEKEEKSEIADELDRELTNLRVETEATRQTITRAINNQENSMMNLLITIQADMIKDREEHQREREEHKIEREKDERYKEQMKKDLNELKDKINIIVKDRIVPGVEDQKRELFIIMATNENDTTSDKKSNWRFPYYIIKCQQGTKDTRELSCRKKYPRAEEIFVLPQPNTKSLSDVLKIKCDERKIPVQFYRSCFYFEDEDTNIQTIINLVRELENERVRV